VSFKSCERTRSCVDQSKPLTCRYQRYQRSDSEFRPSVPQPWSVAGSYRELQTAAELPGEVARDAAAGLVTGETAAVNGFETAIWIVATLGLSASKLLELIGRGTGIEPWDV
jgi:hypothetical protein